jgi:hypothetical protein
VSQLPSLVAVHGQLKRLDELEALPELKTLEAQDRLGASLENLEDDDTMTPPRPPKAEDEKKSNVIGVRFTPPEIERLDRIAEKMREESGVDVPRMSVIRGAINEGLDVLEQRMGLAEKRPVRTGKKAEAKRQATIAAAQRSKLAKP